MTIEEFSKKVDELSEWMEECVAKHPKLSGNKDEDIKTILADIESIKCGDVYEVHVDYHLRNGDVIKTRNHCLETYTHWLSLSDQSYFGDGWMHINYDGVDGLHHQTFVNPKDVCWIDAYSKEIDWDANKEMILKKLELI